MIYINELRVKDELRQNIGGKQRRKQKKSRDDTNKRRMEDEMRWNVNSEQK